jgi:mannosyltransferase OCH1-like enzyme
MQPLTPRPPSSLTCEHAWSLPNPFYEHAIEAPESIKASVDFLCNDLTPSFAELRDKVENIVVKTNLKL